MHGTPEKCIECPMGEGDHDLLVRMDQSVTDLVKLVKGNGQPGLAQRMATLELWRSMLVGAWLLLMAAATIYAAMKK